MRWWFFVPGAVLALAMAAACNEEQKRDLHSSAIPTEATVSETPEVISAAWATLPPDLQQRVERCIKDSGSAQEAVSTLEACLSPDDLSVQAELADGALPVVLIDVEAGRCTGAKSSFFLWRDQLDWHVQSMEAFFGVDPYTRINDIGRPIRPEYVSSNSGARVLAHGGTLEIGVVFATAWCGSGPRESFALFRLIGGTWQLIWRANQSGITGRSHTDIDFLGDGVEAFRVVGSSWFLDDSKRKTFHESNPGPHRYFEQTWVRGGDAYIMQSERVLSSPYNTMVEFFHALNIGDDQRASALATELSLVEMARELGLVRDPADQEWYGWCGDSLTDGPPCAVERPDGSRFVVDFVETESDWLISGIRPE